MNTTATRYKKYDIVKLMFDGGGRAHTAKILNITIGHTQTYTIRWEDEKYKHDDRIEFIDVETLHTWADRADSTTGVFDILDELINGH